MVRSPLLPRAQSMIRESTFIRVRINNNATAVLNYRFTLIKAARSQKLHVSTQDKRR